MDQLPAKERDKIRREEEKKKDQQIWQKQRKTCGNSGRKRRKQIRNWK